MTESILGADFRLRVTTGLLGAPLVLISIYVGPPMFTVLIIVVALICASELRHVICPGSLFGLVTLIAITLSCFVSLIFANYWIMLGTLAIFAALRLGEAIQTRNIRLPLKNYTYQAVGSLYLGLLLSAPLLIRNLDHGMLLTFMLFVSNWATDSFALVGGRLAGRRKLAPRISPGKTVEGTLIGIACGCVVGFVIGLVAGLPIGTALLASLIIPVLTVAGDLLESLIKRSFAVKDAGTILPGHGGFLDRFDGMLLAGPGLYIILALLRIS